MSIRVQSYVWENSKADGSALLLLLAIADHAHDDGTGAWPSIDKLAHKCRQTPRNVQFLLRKLEDLGELQTSIGSGPNGCNAYTIPMEGEKISPPKDSAENFTTPMKTSVKRGRKPAPQISPEPSLTINKEPSNNLSKTPEPETQINFYRELTSEEEPIFQALFSDIETVMPDMTPRECETVKELFIEYPYLDHHLYAFNQTKKYAAGFNLVYYAKCLKGYNGNPKQLAVLANTS